jgi:hypothetical protein
MEYDVYDEELTIIDQLRMYYNSNIFEKMSGMATGGIKPKDRQKFLYTKIFNDTTDINSILTINKLIDKTLVNESKKTPLEKIAAALGMDDDSNEQTLPLLFEMATLHKQTDIETKSLTFGDISWKNTQGEVQQSVVTDLLTSPDELTALTEKDIMILKIKNDNINPAHNSTEACEVFLNYIPTIERSRCIPTLSVNLFVKGPLIGSTERGANMAERVANLISGEAAAIAAKESDIAIPNLSALQFLNDDSKIHKGVTSADAVFTMASTAEHLGEIIPANATSENTTGGELEPSVTQPYTIQRNGMEMFTMPQSLISKKQGVDIDPFRPFMSIKSATITTQSAGQGIIAWNTATLVIEVYDRHRLNDISYFLDPGNFNNTKIELLAGWAHQDPSSPYGKYLNRLKSKEMYVLSSSSYSFNDAGVVTVTLKLAMSGGNEIAGSSMFAVGNDGKDVRALHEELIKSLQAVRAGTTAINSQRTTGNLLPTSVITQENSASAMMLDQNALGVITSYQSQANLEGEERENFSAALTRLGSGQITEYYSALDKYVDEFLQTTGLNVAVEGYQVSDRPGDPYAYVYTTDNKWTRSDTRDNPPTWEPLTPPSVVTAFTARYEQHITESRAAVVSGDRIRFDRLLVNVLAKRMLTGRDSGVDEIHLFIYEFNKYAAGKASTYIGDFEINGITVGEKLKKIIRETQNLTISSFVGAVKSEMKDKMNDQFAIGTEAQRTKISDLEKKIADSQTSVAELITSLEIEQNKLTTAPLPTAIQKQAIDGVIETQTEMVAALNRQITGWVEEKQIEWDAAELQAGGKRVTRIIMPDLKIALESKRSTDGHGRNILRMHVYDGKSKPNEIQEFLANLNNLFSIDIDESAYSATETPSTEPRDTIIKTLTDDGLAEYKNDQLVVNTQSHKLKKVIKASMPSITYGAEGTAINKASMSMVSDANMQASFLLRTQRENSSNTNNAPVGSGEQDAQKIMAANINLNMMGCPILRYGQQYFVDFGTNTDLDNVYGMTKIVHSISPGVFKTSAQLTPAYSSQVSFSGLLQDMQNLTDHPPQVTPVQEPAPTTD